MGVSEKQIYEENIWVQETGRK